jgi:hypothetical protein
MKADLSEKLLEAIQLSFPKPDFMGEHTASLGILPV